MQLDLFTPKEPLITIIAGGRDYWLSKSDKEWLNTLPIKEVVNGGAKGADAGGKAWAIEKGIPVKDMEADWITGKFAGCKRNTDMANYAQAVVLFPGGKGTADMRKKAIKRGLVIYER